MEVKITDLTWSPYIYPRGGKNEKTINAYVEALNIGAQFPPIKIQRVFNYPDSNETTEAILILDGIHRFFAFKERGLTKIAAVEWKEEPLDYEKSKISLLLEAAECNTRHGDRLSPKDKKQIARAIATSDPECTWTEEALAEKLGVIRQTVNTWISDIRARQRANRNITIIRLSRLGWTQEKISEALEMSQGRAAQIINNANFSEINNLLCQGRDMDYISGHYQMDFALAWALRLEGKTDQEKFKELGWGQRTWDQWYFNECDERFGEDWPGRIPAQLVAHALIYFTKPGDFVLDPMAGGAVVSDVCLVFERKCQSFDLVTLDNRPEIQYHHWDPRNGHWPTTKKPKESTPSISSYSKEKYEEFIEWFLLLAHQNVKGTARMAFLNAGKTYFRHSWKNLDNRKEIIMKLCLPR